MTGDGARDPVPPNPLFRAFPALDGRIPWLELGDWPTPVERLEIDAGAVWVKRDDRSSTHYGGNKVRKLEYLLGRAREEGAGRLITSGVVGSHHALATAVHGRRVGLPTTLVLFPQPMTDHAHDMAALNEHWADRVCRCGTFATLPFVEAATRWRERREEPRVIPAGGSSALGTLGYVGGALELAEQVRAGELPRPDTIWVAAGTLGTVAGIAIGAALTDLCDRVVGVRIVPSVIANDIMLGRLVEGALSLLPEAPLSDPRMVMDRVELRGGYVGLGYGHPTAEAADATARFADAGLTLDPSYTAKAAAALLDGLAESPESVHLFWHTLSAVEPERPEGAW